MIVWALFDSGNGCYTQVAKEMEGITIYPIGMDIQNDNNHFINLDLSDCSRLFGDNKLFDMLDSLPHPDLIIASPPCEAWSVASAMAQGNACWKQENPLDLPKSRNTASRFTIRDHKDYDRYQYAPVKSFMTRVNGEMCIFNTIEIIKRYQPTYYIIENPAHGRIWDYIEKVLGFDLEYDNLTYYNNYGYPTKKATRFKSNIPLGLKSENIPNTMRYTKVSRVGGSYNQRSNIPLELVKDIYTAVLKEEEQL